MPSKPRNNPLAFSEREYRFDKVLATLVYLASQPDKVTNFDKKKAISLLFLADKLHLLRYGRPIFAEQYRALKWGTVPQRTLDRLDEFEQQKRLGRDIVALMNALDVKKAPRHDFPIYVAKTHPDLDALSELELAIINEVIEKYGDKDFNALYKPIHPKAWHKAWDRRGGKKAWPMQYEEFFEGDPEVTEGAREELLELSRIKQALSGLR